MEVYRIEKRAFLPTMLAGIPGEKFSFRWNTRGNPMVYTAQSRSLALVEKFANIGLRFGGIPPSFVMVIIEIPDSALQKIDVNTLPDNWNALDEYHSHTQSIGNAFIDSQELGLLVPSVIVREEFNVLLNPAAIRGKRVEFRVEELDDRLLFPVS